MTRVLTVCLLFAVFAAPRAIAQCETCEPGGPARAICPCPDSECRLLFQGTGKLGSWIRYTKTGPGFLNEFLIIGLLAPTPFPLDPFIAVCGFDLTTTPALFVNPALVILGNGQRQDVPVDTWVFIPNLPELVGLEVAAQHLGRASGDGVPLNTRPPFMSSAVVVFTVTN